jgi:hypothetical protein
VTNKSGRIGRDGEHLAAAYLAEAGFNGVEREGKRAASLDVVADDLTVPIEVKRRSTLSIPLWTRAVEAIHGDRWGLFVIQRDARKKLHPDLLIFPAAFGAELLKLYELNVAFNRALLRTETTELE